MYVSVLSPRNLFDVHVILCRTHVEIIMATFHSISLSHDITCHPYIQNSEKMAGTTSMKIPFAYLSHPSQI